jgi:hypothetical protein
MKMKFCECFIRITINGSSVLIHSFLVWPQSSWFNGGSTTLGMMTFAKTINKCDFLHVFKAECHKKYALYAECRYLKYRYAECPVAVKVSPRVDQIIKTHAVDEPRIGFLSENRKF